MSLHLPAPAVPLGPALIAAIVLAAAGAAKVLRPSDTAKALAAAGARWASPGVVRTLAAAELALAVWAGLSAHVVALAGVAVAYMAFAVFVLWAMHQQTPLSTCGCFGEPDTPPTLTHVVVNVALGAAAAWGVSSAPPSIVALAGDHPAATGVFALAVAVASGLVIVVLTEMARVQTTARQTATALLGHDHSRKSPR